MMLLDLAARNSSWIVEDDYDSEYDFRDRPISAVQGLDTTARVTTSARLVRFSSHLSELAIWSYLPIWLLPSVESGGPRIFLTRRSNRPYWRTLSGRDTLPGISG